MRLIGLAALCFAVSSPQAQPRYVSRVKLPKGPFLTYERAKVSCGLRRDGTIGCYDEAGELLQNYAPSGKYKQLSFLNGQGCAISKTDTVDCFGTDMFGNLPSKPPQGKVRDIAALGRLICWIDAQGTIACADKKLAQKPRGRFRQIACTYYSCCALDEKGELQCFGESSKLTSPPKGKFVALAVEGVLGCAIDPAGEIQCWGAPDEVPKTVPKGPFAKITIRNRVICALRNDGRGSCFSGRKQPREITVPMTSYSDDCGVDLAGEVVCTGEDFLGPIPEGRFVEVVGGNDVMCALDESGKATCWGTSELISQIPREPLAEISFGSVRFCARVRASGKVMCRGFETLPPPVIPLTSITAGTATCGLDKAKRPVCWAKSKETAPNEPVLSLSSGEATSCAVMMDGRLKCWLTYGYIADHVETVAPPEDASYASVVVGYEHGCALRKSGEAVCWGRDTAGETQAPKGTFKQLVLGEKRSCGLALDGSVQCWGGNPAEAPKGERYERIAITTDKALDSPTFCCGLLADSHRLSCWSYERTQ